jgi:hypothetical protein
MLAFMARLPHGRLALGVLLALAAVLVSVAVSGRSATTSVKLIVVGFDTNESGAFAIIQLTNSGPRSIGYGGHLDGRPWYHYAFDTPMGRSNYFLSGVPSDFRWDFLEPRRGVDFTVPRGSYRIGVSYMEKTAASDRVSRIWDAAPLWVRRVLGPVVRCLERERFVYTSPLSGRSENGS